MLRGAVAHAAQPVVRAVGQGDGLLVAVEALQREHRAEDLVLHDLAILAHVGEQRGLVVLCAEGVVRPAPEQRGAIGHGTLHEAVHALHLARVDDGSDLGGLVARVTHGELFHIPAQCGHEGIVHLAVHQEARARQAHLAGVAVHQRAGGCGVVDVGVFQHDESRLTAQLQAAGHEVGTGRLRDPLGRGHGSGERDARQARVADQARAGAGARALHDVEHPGRQASGMRAVGQQAAGERRPLRRLDDDTVACGERRAQLPGGEHQRCVPGRDDGDHPGRIMAHDVGGLFGLDGTVLQGKGMLREPGDVEHGARHHTVLHAREQHARIVGFKRAEGLGALSDLGGKAVQIGLALGRRERAPGRKGARRCADGRIHMGGRAFADAAQQRLVDGRVQVEAHVGRHALAVDVVVG